MILLNEKCKKLKFERNMIKKLFRINENMGLLLKDLEKLCIENQRYKEKVRVNEIFLFFLNGFLSKVISIFFKWM